MDEVSVCEEYDIDQLIVHRMFPKTRTLTNSIGGCAHYHQNSLCVTVTPHEITRVAAHSSTYYSNRKRFTIMCPVFQHPEVHNIRPQKKKCFTPKQFHSINETTNETTSADEDETDYTPDKQLNPFMGDYTIVLEKWVLSILTTTNSSVDITAKFIQRITHDDFAQVDLLMCHIATQGPHEQLPGDAGPMNAFQRDMRNLKFIFQNNDAGFQLHFNSFIFRLLLMVMTRRFIIDGFLQPDHLSAPLISMLKSPLKDIGNSETQWQFRVGLFQRPGFSWGRGQSRGQLLQIIARSVHRIAEWDTQTPMYMKSSALLYMSCEIQAMYMQVPLGSNLSNLIQKHGIAIDPVLLMLPKCMRVGYDRIFRTSSGQQTLLKQYPLHIRKPLEDTLARSRLHDVFAFRRVQHIEPLSWLTSWHPQYLESEEPLYTIMTPDRSRSTAYNVVNLAVSRSLHRICKGIEQEASQMRNHLIYTQPLSIGHSEVLYTKDHGYDEGIYECAYGLIEQLCGVLFSHTVICVEGLWTYVQPNIPADIPVVDNTEVWEIPVPTEKDIQVGIRRAYANITDLNNFLFTSNLPQIDIRKFTKERERYLMQERHQWVSEKKSVLDAKKMEIRQLKVSRAEISNALHTERIQLGKMSRKGQADVFAERLYNVKEERERLFVQKAMIEIDLRYKTSSSKIVTDVSIEMYEMKSRRWHLEHVVSILNFQEDVLRGIVPYHDPRTVREVKKVQTRDHGFIEQEVYSQHQWMGRIMEWNIEMK